MFNMSKLYTTNMLFSSNVRKQTELTCYEVILFPDLTPLQPTQHRFTCIIFKMLAKL